MLSYGGRYSKARNALLYFTHNVLYFTNSSNFLTMVHLGNNVARMRGFKRITQKQLADKLGMTQQEYSRLESKQQIDDDLLERIARALDYPVELIKQLDAASVVNNNQQGGNAGNIFYQYSHEQIAEVYEKLLLEKDNVIKMKDEIIRQKDEVIEMYRKQQNAS